MCNPVCPMAYHVVGPHHGIVATYFDRDFFGFGTLTLGNTRTNGVSEVKVTESTDSWHESKHQR